jgi:hypothetical protein
MRAAGVRGPSPVPARRVPGDADRSPLKLAGDIPPPGPATGTRSTSCSARPSSRATRSAGSGTGDLRRAGGGDRPRRTSVDVVLYIWRPGRPRPDRRGARRARPGVACRIVVDPVGSTPAFQREVMPRLQQAACEVHVFRPLGTTRWVRRWPGTTGRSSSSTGDCLHRRFGISDRMARRRVHDRGWRDTPSASRVGDAPAAALLRPALARVARRAPSRDGGHREPSSRQAMREPPFVSSSASVGRATPGGPG